MNQIQGEVAEKIMRDSRREMLHGNKRDGLQFKDKHNSAEDEAKEQERQQRKLLEWRMAAQSTYKDETRSKALVFGYQRNKYPGQELPLDASKEEKEKRQEYELKKKGRQIGEECADKEWAHWANERVQHDQPR